MRSSWSEELVNLSDLPNSWEIVNFCGHIGFCSFSQDWQSHYGNMDVSTWELILCNCNFAYANEKTILSEWTFGLRCKAPFNYKNSMGLSSVMDSSIPSTLSLSKFFYFFLDFLPPLLSLSLINDRSFFFLMPFLWLHLKQEFFPPSCWLTSANVREF